MDDTFFFQALVLAGRPLSLAVPVWAQLAVTASSTLENYFKKS